MFSNQFFLAYNEKDKSYKNLYQRIRNEDLLIGDSDYLNNDIEWLLDKKYLIVEDGYVKVNDKNTMCILKDLYYNDVISYWRCSRQKRNIIDVLNQRNIVKFENSLFSRAEQDYFDYILNKSKYNNGLNLRNKYSHTQPKSEDHQENYFILLRLFVLTVIKINEDFCLDDEIRKGIIQ